MNNNNNEIRLECKNLHKEPNRNQGNKKKSWEEVIRISHVKPAISNIKYGQGCQDTLH